MERLHILDGYGYIFRAFYGMANAGRGRAQVRLSNAEGLPTGALHVYASMLLRLHQEEAPERVVVVFDAPGKNFRDELDPNYKKTRRETPEDLKKQMPFFRPLTEAFCWPVMSVSGVEADDSIATLAGRASARGWQTVIYSGDKDLMQLVDDQVTVIDSMRQIVYDHDKVIAKFGVAPKQLGDWLALVGDTSDNVPGMVGVGKVGATKLLTSYGDLAGILSNVEDLKGKQRERFCDAANIAQLEVSKKLVTLKCDVELPFDLDACVPRPWDGAALEELCERFDFGNLLTRLRGHNEKPSSPRTGAALAAPVKTSARPPNTTVHAPVEVTLVAAEVVVDPERIAAELLAATEAGRMALYAEGDGTGHDRERLVGLGLAVPGRTPVYLPIAHRYLGAPRAMDADTLSKVGEVLSSPDLLISCHDMKRIQGLLARESITLQGVHMDLMLAGYLLDPARDFHVAQDALSHCLGMELESRETMVGKGKRAIAWDMVEVSHAAMHCGPILCGLLVAAEVMGSRLQAEGMHSLFYDIELPLARVLGDLEARGVCLDQRVLAEISHEMSARILAIEARVFEKAGGPFNIGSPKQLSKLLFDTLGLRSSVMKKTKTGHSTDHEVLEAMIDSHEIIEPIIEHRELLKLKGTYVDALPPLVNAKTQRLHTCFRQDVAATGRLSSQDPNLQNIPIRTEMGRSIRRAFVAPEGRTLISADYSQIELRIMAHLSEDPVLLRAFREGVDVHTQTAAEVFDLPLDQVGSTERRVAKAVNYGLIYGQSEFGLSRSLGITRAEAGHYIRRYFERFARVRSFMDDIVNLARVQGAAYTVCGRKRLIPGLSAKNFQLRSAAERIAQNTPMQGSAADIMKLAMLKVDALLRDTNSQLLLTVHDELIIEADQEVAQALSLEVKREMESAYTLLVPLTVDVGIAMSWADAH